MHVNNQQNACICCFNLRTDLDQIKTLLEHYKTWESTTVFAVFTARLIMTHRIQTICPTRKLTSCLKSSDQGLSNDILFDNIGAIEVPELWT